MRRSYHLATRWRIAVVAAFVSLFEAAPAVSQDMQMYSYGSVDNTGAWWVEGFAEAYVIAYECNGRPPTGSSNNPCYYWYSLELGAVLKENDSIMDSGYEWADNPSNDVYLYLATSAVPGKTYKIQMEADVSADLWVYSPGEDGWSENPSYFETQSGEWSVYVPPLNPQIAGVSPSSAYRDDSSANGDMWVSGSDFSPTASDNSVSVSGGGVNVNVVQGGSDGLYCQYSIDSDATPGARNVKVTVMGVSSDWCGGCFTVLRH